MCSMDIAVKLHLREVSVSRTIRKIRSDRNLPFTVFKVEIPQLKGRASAKWWLGDRPPRSRRRGGRHQRDEVAPIVGAVMTSRHN